MENHYTGFASIVGHLQSSTKFRRLGEQKANVSSGFLNDEFRGTDALSVNYSLL